MALSRRNGQRFEANIWPGFVDAMTALLLVLVFVLSIFMIVQFTLRETITSQDTELEQLAGQVQTLAEALGLEQQRGFELEEQVDRLDGALQSQFDEVTRQNDLIASLTAQNQTQAGRIASFEEQVAGLLTERDGLQARVVGLSAERDDLRAETARSADENAALVARIEDIEAGLAREITEKEAVQLALAQARSEIDAGTEAARLAAARREALEALLAEVQSERDTAQEALSAAEAAQLVDRAAAQALRERLENADAELTAMSLALEAQRKDAEETLTLLAAANSAKEELDAQLLSILASAQNAQTEASQARAQLQEDLVNARSAAEQAEAARAELQALLDTEAAKRDIELADLRAQIAAALAARVAAEQANTDALSEAQQREILLATARSQLAESQKLTEQSQLQVEALNQQVAALRSQLGSLQALLDDAQSRDEAADVQISALGSRLNTALAQVAAEQKRTADEQARRLALEEAERVRLEEEAKELRSYRSEFFGRLRDLLGAQDGVLIQGDRFVFSSEVLFQPARADLSAEGQVEIAKVARILQDVASEIPDDLNWIIRVDGHTDSTPLSGFGQFADNWELSQARALSVVRYMSQQLGIPANRLAANGFGEFQPVSQGDSPEALAANRRIELKLTEK
ncbi:MAG: peptidoglycan -binding protein [Pseudomonadota bacterium]